MRILIYGAGVIGSFYAALFSEAGVETAVYARGNRLKILTQQGLQYETDRQIKTANVNILSTLATDDIYDFIFLTVRENQLHQALTELAANHSSYIVTMVNSLENYSVWEQICGPNRIIPAFPGAGGSIEDGVLHAALTPKVIQPTTFAILHQTQNKQAQELKALFSRAKIPYQQVADMHTWQICHLAMVVPIADAYYKAHNPQYAGKDRLVMAHTAKDLQTNFKKLAQCGIKLSPKKMHIFRFLPLFLLRFILSLTFQSKFGNIFMYRHAIKAPDEMRTLHEQFYNYLAHLSS